MIQAVIFDMDGVLIDSEGDYLEWITGYAKKRGYDIPKETLKKTIGLSSSMIADFFMDLMGKSAGKKFWYEFVEESYTYPFDYQKALNPGVKTLLQKLREHRILTGLASASDYKDIELMLCSNNLEKYFDVVLSGADFVESKPNPEIYLAYCQKLGVLPETCMIIEDSEYGIESGKAAGAMVIAIEDTRFGFVQNRADYLVKKFGGNMGYSSIRQKYIDNKNPFVPLKEKMPENRIRRFLASIMNKHILERLVYEDA